MRRGAFAVVLLWCAVSAVQAQDGAQKLSVEKTTEPLAAADLAASSAFPD
jgi:hypothetical protein